jgi:hypothetical protein
MATCPICTVRAAKRYCPAKESNICAVCCGTIREVEVLCPADCSHLRAARAYESEKQAPDPALVDRVQRFDRDFIQQFTPILDVVSRAIVEERQVSRWMVDADIADVYQALTKTLKTLASGIYYESLPEGPVRISLFRRLRAVFEEFMQPQTGDRKALKVLEALDILDFLALAAQLNAGRRPKSRQYLDWLTAMVGAPPAQAQPSSLILP